MSVMGSGFIAIEAGEVKLNNLVQVLPFW